MSIFQFVNGSPWTQQYLFNEAENLAPGDWSYDSSPWPNDMAGYRQLEFVTKDRVYLVGPTYSYTAPIDAAGVIGAWTTTPNIPLAVEYGTAIVTKGKVHLIGYTTTNVYLSATINADGTIGSWSTGGSTPALGAIGGSSIVTRDRVYYIGNGSTTIYSAPINQDGTLGTWVTHTSALPEARRSVAVAAIGNRVYILGGYGALHMEGGVNKYTYISSRYAEFGDNGLLGAWSAGPDLPESRHLLRAVVTAKDLYIIGGTTGTTPTNCPVYRATVQDDLTFSDWVQLNANESTQNPLPVVVTSSRLYQFATVWTSVPRRAYYLSFIGGSNDYSTLTYVEIPPPGVYIPTKIVGAREFIAYTGDGNFVIPSAFAEAVGSYSIAGDGRFTFQNVQIRAVGPASWYGIGNTVLRTPDVNGKEAGKGHSSIPRARVAGLASSPYIASGLFRPPMIRVNATGSFLFSQAALLSKFNLKPARILASGSAPNISTGASYSITVARAGAFGGTSPQLIDAGFDVMRPNITARGWLNDEDVILAYDIEEQAARISTGTTIDSILQFNRD